MNFILVIALSGSLMSIPGYTSFVECNVVASSLKLMDATTRAICLPAPGTLGTMELLNPPKVLPKGEGVD